MILNNLIYLMRTNTIIKELYLIRGREVGCANLKTNGIKKAESVDGIKNSKDIKKNQAVSNGKT